MVSAPFSSALTAAKRDLRDDSLMLSFRSSQDFPEVLTFTNIKNTYSEAV